MKPMSHVWPTYSSSYNELGGWSPFLCTSLSHPSSCIISTFLYSLQTKSYFLGLVHRVSDLSSAYIFSSDLHQRPPHTHCSGHQNHILSHQHAFAHPDTPAWNTFLPPCLLHLMKPRGPQNSDTMSMSLFLLDLFLCA